MKLLGNMANKRRNSVDRLFAIQNEETRARSLLTKGVFSSRRCLEFELFLQAFSAGFMAKHTSEKDTEELKKFAETVSLSKSTRRERLELFLIAAAKLKQYPGRRPELENSLIKRIVDNNGCLEFDPLSVIYSGQAVTTISTTLVGFEPNFHSSYYLPSQIIGQKSKELFQERMRLLYTEIAKLSRMLKDFESTARVQADFEEFLFELYENILDHAKDAEVPLPQSAFPHHATFWFIRFERFAVPSSGIETFVPSIEAFKDYAKSLEYAKDRKPKLLVSLSVYDNGPGIFGHYSTRNSKEFATRDFFSFERVLLEKRTSKAHLGSGWGIKRALEALARLDGFVSIRSNEFWAAKLPNEDNFRNIGLEQNVSSQTLGTLYSILLPVW